MWNFLLERVFFIDPLALFFLAVIIIVSLPSFIYSFGYLKGEYSASRIRFVNFLLLIFVLSMVSVVSVKNCLVFLVFWEIMSLVSYFLVVFDSEHEKSVQAGLVYIVMTHIGTAFIIAAFMILRNYAHSFDFFAIKEACKIMPAAVKDAVFLLFLAGFGTKAGIVPLHIWLPYAHPQAPSHISSIMSGVMIKTAIYGIARFVLFILGVNSAWWGILILVLATITCLTGVIYALMERDLKRLLAYSSVENIGIIFLGVGLAVLFTSLKLHYLAVFSLAAGLYHLINHAVFKGLLFLCAGSIYKATGTRNIEKLGGLIKKMPQTAGYFLLGAMAISALPPLNGFVSEWLTLQAFFLGAFRTGGGNAIFLGLCAAMLALTGGLAAACFVKAFGVTFLAQPRSHYAEGAKEVALSMRAGMLILSVSIVALGLGAVPVLKLLAGIAGGALGIDTGGMSFSLNNFIIAPQSVPHNCLSTPWLALWLVIFGAAGFWAYRLSGAGKSVRYKTWDCGYYKLDARNEYTAAAFSNPFRVAFNFFLLSYYNSRKIWSSFYRVKSFSYETHTTQVFKKYIYDPAIALIFRSARLMRRMQPGSIHLYLGYIFAALILLILFMGKF